MNELQPLSPNQNSVQPKTTSHDHRYMPTEQPRQAIGSMKPQLNQLASEVVFKPVTTIEHSNQKVFIRPVTNVRSRPVAPLPINNPEVKLQGERAVSLSKELHQQIQAQAAAAAEKIKPNEKAHPEKYITSSDLHIQNPKAQISSKPHTSDADPYNQQIKTELSEINKILFEQIKKRVAWELDRQKGLPQRKIEEKTTQPNPILTTVKAPATPLKPPALVTPPKLEPPPPEVKKPEETEPNYGLHITELEKEVHGLNQEILNLETILKTVPSQMVPEEVGQLEKKIEIDERMLKAVADWRQTLDNLIDSHSTALKYLKAKSEWIEDKTLSKMSHSRKHEKLHKKPRSVSFSMPELSNQFSELDTIAAKEINVKEIIKPTIPLGVSEPVVSLNRDIKIPSPDLKLQPTTLPTDTSKSAPPISNQPDTNPVLAPPTQVPSPELAENPNQALVAGKVAFAPNAAPTGPVIGKVAVSGEDNRAGFTIGNVGVTGATSIRKEVGSLGLNTQAAQGQNFGSIGVQANAPASTPLATNPATSQPPKKIIEQQTVIVKPAANEQTKTEIIQKPPVQMTSEEANKIGTTLGVSPLGPVVEQQTVVIRPEQATVVQPEKAIVKEIPTKVDVREVAHPAFETVRDMVIESLRKENLNKGASGANSAPVDEDRLKSLIKEAIQNHSETSAIKTVEMLKPSKEIAEVVISESSQNPVQEVVSMSSPSTSRVKDVERMILEQADAEEKVREDKQRKIEADKKQALEVKGKALQAAKQAPTPTETLVSPEELKNTFEKLKSSLTTLGQNPSLTTEMRKKMLGDLQRLENDSNLTRQFDELKAKNERKRIDQELKSLLEKSSTPIITVPEANPAIPTHIQKIETLKIEEKTKTTPEEKARIIAEIKNLERLGAAKRATEVAKPVVKAQPAFGKMLPNTPTIPNVINGIVKDNRGLLLSTVVIIVKDKDGEPVRAFKSNKIGQFALSTPVPNGVFTLELEKEGYDFDNIEVDVNGEIMRPIEIKAK